MRKVPVVFLSADPLSAPPLGHKARLGLDEDLRGILETVRAAKYRDVLEFDVRPAARIEDVAQALLETKPQIVHFSGHGKNEGIMLVGRDSCTPHWVSANSLTELFTAFRDDICVVVLSACSTRSQAEAIAEVVGCAIGTPAAIADEAAIAFNAEFYRAIAFGQSVKGAYEKACAIMGTKELDKVRPELVVRRGVDAAQLVLIPPPVRIGGWVTAAALLVSAGLALAQVPEKRDGLQPPVQTVDSVSRPTEDVAAARELYRVGNYAASFPLFKRAAEAGNTEAMGFLGMAYMRGEGTGRVPDSAAHWLTLAANAGDTRGMNALGLAFEDGFGVGRSYRFARQWYEAAARKNDAEAMRSLARLHRQGLGIVRRDSLAFDWYQKAVRAGSVEAMVDVGLMYAEGVDGQRDADQALNWFQQASEKGSHRAMHAIGRLHEDAKDYGQALVWYRKAADAGSAEGMNNLGVLYQNGWGVTSDRAAAARWYRQAAASGSPVAAANLTTLEGS